MRSRIAAALVAAATLSAAHRQVAPVLPTSAAGDWPMYNRDLAGTRHSPLTQITPANVSRLTRAWTFRMGPDPSAGSITGGSEYTPLVVNGVMYVATAQAVHALDAATGKPVWRYDMDTGTPSKRGVTFWPGSGDIAARVFFTAGRRLVALEAEIGRRAEGFGKNGEVDMGQMYTSAPTLYRGMLLVGSNSAPGAVRAFDARTGTKLWEFQSVPQQAGARGQDTWERGSWKGATGAISWAFSMTIDEARNTLYAVFDSPTPDYYGGNRHGDNLFANSIVALDASTGTYKWHFQTTHHDL